MTINLDQYDEPEKQKLSQDAEDQINFSGESRRRFATSGLAVSGIILTLASRPVLGQTFCESPSGFVSGNISHHGACPSVVAAKFITNPDETFIAAFPKSSQSNASFNNKLLSEMLTIPWPEPQLATVNAPVQVEKGKLGAASYMTTFRASPGSNSSAQKGKGTSNKTVPTSSTSASVIAPANPPFQTQELLQHIVKALQNARSGATPYLSADTIQSMFYEWQNHGTFSPTANVNWNASEIIYYLKQTQNN